METICFYASYFDNLFGRRVLSSGYIIDGTTKEDALNYLKDCDFMQDIKIEYFARNTYYVEDSIVLDLFKKFDKKF